MNKKKIRKSLFFVVVAVILIAAVCNVFSFFTTGKQRISVSTNNTYYTGGDINATVSVKKVENDKQIDAKVTMELYDEDKKKVSFHPCALKGWNDTFLKRLRVLIRTSRRFR